MLTVSDYRRDVTADVDQSMDCLNDSGMKSASAAQVNEVRSKSCSVPSTSSTYNETTFPDAFVSANCRAWTQIIDDPLFSLKESVKGSVFVEYSKILLTYCDVLLTRSFVFDAISQVFVNRSLITQSERELIVVDIQGVRMSGAVVQDFVHFVTAHIPSADICSCQQLFQVWMRKFVVEIFNDASKRFMSSDNGSERASKSLTEVDQNVLYHICGYMAMKLKTASKRYKKLGNMSELIQCLTTKEPKNTGHFVESYRKWVEQQSRGGLLYPIPTYYLLVREFDNIYQTTVKICYMQANSVDKIHLQTSMHEAFMVKYYWNQIIEMAHQHELSSLPVLDYLISLFITIKGFATARKERERLTVERGKKANPSKSLRGKLKKH